MQLFGWDLHYYAWLVAGVATVLACLISLYLVYKHLRNYTQPHLQRYIVRILLLVPIYAVDSFLSLLFKDYSVYFDLVRDCYEAYVLYQFFNLLVAFINTNELEQVAEEETQRVEQEQQEIEAGLRSGHTENTGLLDEAHENAKRSRSLSINSDFGPVSEYDQVVRILSAKPRSGHPWPTCCFPKFQPGRAFLRWSQRAILQFVATKPLLAIVAIVLEPLGYYGDGDFTPTKAYLYITIIDNLSITIAMYFLVLFYHVTSEDLKKFKPVLKFLCIKAVIFFAFWQGVVIAVLAYFGVLKATETWSERNVTTGLQDFIICIEMFLIAIAHAFAFGYDTYRNPNKIGFVRGILRGNVRETVSPMLKNFGHVVQQKDVLEESLDVFGIEKAAQTGKRMSERALDATVQTGKEVLSSAGRVVSKSAPLDATDLP